MCILFVEVNVLSLNELHSFHIIFVCLCLTVTPVQTETILHQLTHLLGLCEENTDL